MTAAEVMLWKTRIGTVVFDDDSKDICSDIRTLARHPSKAGTDDGLFASSAEHIQPVGRIKGREPGLYHLGRWGQGNPSQRAQNKIAQKL